MKLTRLAGALVFRAESRLCLQCTDLGKTLLIKFVHRVTG